MAQRDQSPFVSDTGKGCVPKWEELYYLYWAFYVLQATLSTVFTVFILTDSLLLLLRPHTSFSNFRRGVSVSLNYWCCGTPKVTLRSSRHVGSLTQLTYVSIIVTLCEFF